MKPTTREITAANLQPRETGNQASTQSIDISANEFRLGTSEFANLNLVQENSVRRRLCVTGSYFGIHPVKLLNGRLAWPAVRVVR